MKVLFLTVGNFASLDNRNIYTDLLREFIRNGHDVYVITPMERREKKKTTLVTQDHAVILRQRTANNQKCSMIEKGISVITIPFLYQRAICKYFRDVHFDLILYSTPPITLASVIRFVKKRDGARTYLLLKDIFPQNAVDIGVMKKSGLKGLLYRYFRSKEKELYRISDRIGCMSQANADYVVRNNPQVDPAKVEICPNSVEAEEIEFDAETRSAIRAQYGIPQDKKVFVYGGNLGKPQGIPFLIECIKRERENENVHFLVVGTGTEYPLFREIADQPNFTLKKAISKTDYDKLVAACDAGMIFLDYRFTIPNFPSRLLGYMQAGLPMLAATDESTDIGDYLVENGIGAKCPSNDVERFHEAMEELCGKTYDRARIIGLLKRDFSVARSYSIIEEGCR